MGAAAAHNWFGTFTAFYGLLYIPPLWFWAMPVVTRRKKLGSCYTGACFVEFVAQMCYIIILGGFFWLPIPPVAFKNAQ
jgi:hypothetical protein